MHPLCDYPECPNPAVDDGRCSVHSGTRIPGEPVQHHPSMQSPVTAAEQLLIDEVDAAVPPDAQPDPEAEPQQGPTIPTQAEFDQGILGEMLVNARRGYAICKARWYLTSKGIPDPMGENQNHPNQHMDDMRKHANGVAELERLLAEGMPAPLGGEVLYLPGAKGGAHGA